MENIQRKKNEPQSQDLEIHSEEIQEILSKIPGWIIQWGITLIFLILVVFLIASWFIQYPDTISARVIATTKIPPTSIVARATGRLNLFVEDQQSVNAQDFLGVIENPADIDDMFDLIELIEECKIHIIDTDSINHSTVNLFLSKKWNLGSVQNSFLAFKQSIRDYAVFYDIKAYDQQIFSLEERINNYESLNQQLKKQISLVEKEMNLIRQRFQTDSLLHSQKVIADLDLSKSKSTYLQAERAYESAKSSIMSNTIQIAQLQSQIIVLNNEFLHQKVSLRSHIYDNLDQLENQLTIWKQQFLLQPPINGEVSFSTYWSDNQFVDEGDIVMSVIPSSQEVFAKLFMPIVGSGKVEVGQKVNIKFDTYPSGEYGIISGRIESISLVPTDNFYTLKVSLPNPLITSYGISIKFRPEMQGSAEIITEKLRLIERVFNQLRALVTH